MEYFILLEAADDLSKFLNETATVFNYFKKEID